MKFSSIVAQVPEYPFAKIGRIAAMAEQRDSTPVIRATIGNPDKEAPHILKEFMVKYLRQEGSTYGYPCDSHPKQGIPELIEAIIADYKRKYAVNLEPGNIAVTSWAKETIHNLIRLFGPGKVHIPDPVYPAYESATLLSGNTVERVRTSQDTQWLPQFRFTPEESVALYFCDPNNPVGSVAGIDYYSSLAKDMKTHNVAGIFDKAYKDYILDESVKPVSITQVPVLMEHGFEVYSFSKHYNMVGVGLGWIVSSAQNIETWLRLSGHLNQGVAWYKQKAGVEALTNPDVQAEMKEYFQELRFRQKMMVDGLNSLGLKTKPSPSTPYLWVAVPEPYTDEDFVIDVINKAHVAFTPGSYFGDNGKGYMRATLFITRDKIQEALERMHRIRRW